MSEHPDDHLFSEEFELSDELDPSSLSALFSEEEPVKPARRGLRARKAQPDTPDAASSGDDELVELDDTPDDARPEPAFGTLADDERPVLGETDVFAPLRGDDLPAEEDPFADLAAPDGPVDIDETPAPPAKLGWRDKVALARGEQPPARGSEPPQDADDDADTPGDEEDRPAKLSLRDRMRIARAEATGDNEPLALDVDEQPKPKRKLSLRDRVNAVKQTPAQEPADDDDEDAPVLVDLDSDTSLEDIDAPAFEGGAAGEETPSSGGLRGWWAQRREMASRADKAPAAARAPKSSVVAGMDVSAPSFTDKVRDRLRRPAAKATPQERASRFGELLTPLSPAELQMLQQEVAADTPLFARIETTRRRAHNQQRWGFIVGMLTTAFFFVSVGKNYLTDLLPNAAQPSWLYDAMLNLVEQDASRAENLAGGLLFGMGLLLPLLAAMVLSDAVRYVWRGLADKRIDDLLLGSLAVLCAGVMYKSLQSAEVMTALMGLAAWWFCRALVRALTRLVRRGGV